MHVSAAFLSPHSDNHGMQLLLLGVCTGSRVPVLPVGTSGKLVQNTSSTRKPEVADDIMYSARVHIHVILRMSTQCVREGVHCGVTM